MLYNDEVIKKRQTKGTVTYKNDLILSVINLATQEIAGVSSLDNTSLGVLERWFNKNYSQGVKISMRDNLITVDVYINVYFGYNVSEIAYRVQENIGNSLSSMVDLKVDKINVHVVGVDFPKDETN